MRCLDLSETRETRFTIVGALIAAAVLAAVLIPLRAKNLLSDYQSWPFVIATPLAVLFLIAGTAVVPWLKQSLGLPHLSVKSCWVDLLYLATLALAVFAITAIG